MSSPIPWLTQAAYDALPLGERALHHVALEYALFGDRNLEVEGNNRGEHIRRYGEVAGLRDGIPWCGLLLGYCFQKAGKIWTPEQRRLIPSSCHWLHSDLMGAHLDHPVRGCIGGWCNQSKWQGHVFFVADVRKRLGATYLRTYEGNTNRAGSREGDCISMKWRRATSSFRFRMIHE